MNIKKTYSKFFDRILNNKVIIIIILVSLFFICMLISIIGRALSWDEISYVITDNVLAACLIAIVTLSINWNLKNEYESIFEQIKTEAETRTKQTISESRKNAQNSQESQNRAVRIASSLENVLSRNCLFCRSNIKNIYVDREEADLRNYFKSAEKSIKVLVTNLESIKNCTKILIEKAQSGVSVQICALDPVAAKSFNLARITGGNSNPETRFYHMRSSLEEYLEQNEECFEKSITDPQNELHNKPTSLHIKTYSLPPTIILFIVDNECVVSYILHRSFARNLPHFHFRFDNTDNIYNRHFNGVFQDGTDISRAMVLAWQYDTV